MKKYIPVILLFFSLFFSANAQTIDYKYQMMFINNFAKNIEWPADAQSDEFIIGVYENAKVAGEMETFFTGKSINGKKVTVKKFANLESISDCHILFIPISNKNNLSQVAARLGSKPVLLITEKEGWGKQGSVINFVITDDGRMKFELNKDAAQKRALKVPGSLVNLAIVL